MKLFPRRAPPIPEPPPKTEPVLSFEQLQLLDEEITRRKHEVNALENLSTESRETMFFRMENIMREQVSRRIETTTRVVYEDHR